VYDSESLTDTAFYLKLLNQLQKRKKIQRGSGGPIPGNIPAQVGRGSEQPDPVEDSPAHCRGLGLDDLSSSLPTHSML